MSGKWANNDFCIMLNKLINYAAEMRLNYDYPAAVECVILA